MRLAWKRRFGFLAALTCLLVARAGAAEKAIDPLDGSVEGSIQLMLNIYRTNSEKDALAFVQRYFNPAAKPELMRQMKIHPQRELLISAFGYLAEAGDLDFYRNIYENKETTFDYRSIFPPAHALGVMSRRGVAGADALLDIILSPNFWKERKINMNEMPHPLQTGGGPECEVFIYMVPIKARTADPRRYEKIAAALDEIKNEHARNKIASETQVANYVHGIPRYTALAENYVKNIQPELDRKSSEFRRKQQEEAEKRMQKFEQKARKDATYQVTVKVQALLKKPKNYLEYSGSSKADLVNEASGFLDAVIKPWLDDPVEVMKKSTAWGRMAEVGFPLFHPVKLSPNDPDGAWLLGRGKSREYIEEVRSVAAVLLWKQRDLQHARVFALGRSLAPEVLRDPKSQAEVIVVSIPVKDAEALKTKFPKFFKNENGIEALASVDTGGVPTLHMIYYRHLNKWFWNLPN